MYQRPPGMNGNSWSSGYITDQEEMVPRNLMTPDPSVTGDDEEYEGLEPCSQRETPIGDDATRIRSSSSVIAQLDRMGMRSIRSNQGTSYQRPTYSRQDSSSSREESGYRPGSISGHKRPSSQNLGRSNGFSNCPPRGGFNPYRANYRVNTDGNVTTERFQRRNRRNGQNSVMNFYITVPTQQPAAPPPPPQTVIYPSFPPLFYPPYPYPYAASFRPPASTGRVESLPSSPVPSTSNTTATEAQEEDDDVIFEKKRYNPRAKKEAEDRRIRRARRNAKAAEQVDRAQRFQRTQSETEIYEIEPEPILKRRRSDEYAVRNYYGSSSRGTETPIAISERPHIPRETPIDDYESDEAGSCMEEDRKTPQAQFSQRRIDYRAQNDGFQSRASVRSESRVSTRYESRPSTVNAEPIVSLADIPTIRHTPLPEFKTLTVHTHKENGNVVHIPELNYEAQSQVREQNIIDLDTDEPIRYDINSYPTGDLLQQCLYHTIPEEDESSEAYDPLPIDKDAPIDEAVPVVGKPSPKEVENSMTFEAAIASINNLESREPIAVPQSKATTSSPSIPNPPESQPMDSDDDLLKLDDGFDPSTMDLDEEALRLDEDEQFDDLATADHSQARAEVFKKFPDMTIDE